MNTFILWRYTTANTLDLILEEELIEEENVELHKDKTRANKRRLDRIKEGRKATTKTYIQHEAVCPKEKRLRKRKGVRKVRHNNDVGQFNAYKKECDIHV